MHEEIPPGSLNMLILKTLSRDGECHGFEIAESIATRSADVLRVEEGSPYPALEREIEAYGRVTHAVALVLRPS